MWQKNCGNTVSRRFFTLLETIALFIIQRDGAKSGHRKLFRPLPFHQFFCFVNHQKLETGQEVMKFCQGLLSLEHCSATWVLHKVTGNWIETRQKLEVKNFVYFQEKCKLTIWWCDYFIKNILWNDYFMKWLFYGWGKNRTGFSGTFRTTEK